MYFFHPSTLRFITTRCIFPNFALHEDDLTRVFNIAEYPALLNLNLNTVCSPDFLDCRASQPFNGRFVEMPVAHQVETQSG